MLRRSTGNTVAPLGVSAPIVTRHNWQFRCLASMDPRNGEAGQAFVAISPDGTEYRFDWMARRELPSLTKANSANSAAANLKTPSTPTESLSAGPRGGAATPMAIVGNALARVEVWILPTRITDRFGNTVTYTYDSTNKWQLKTIVGNDGAGTPRTITFSYVSPTSSLVSSVSDGTRTWTYHYGGATGLGALQSVTLPDNSTWQLAGLDALAFGVDYLGPGNCDEPGMVKTPTRTGTAIHPSGATAEFVLTSVRHGRVGVLSQCMKYVEPYAEVPYFPKQFDTYALTKKTISGPGLPTMEWTTAYSTAVSGWAPWNQQNGSKQVEVRNPDGHLTRHTFGTVFMETEGQLQLVEHIDRNGGIVRSTTTRYVQPVPPRGESDQTRGDGVMAARGYETSRREISQQGTAFIWEATSFNDFAQPTRVVKSSSQGPLRVEVTTFNNSLSKWVLGQVETVTETNTNTQVVRNAYDSATANLESVSRFGLLEKSMTYRADGTIATEKDGRNGETRYDNYRRGIPQTVVFADGTTIGVGVNNLGGIDTYTDALGATTTFGYDGMGRFKSISYPGGDPLTWNPTLISFEQVWSTEYDLAPGHWRQTIRTGTGYEVNYVDAFWRPVYSERWDGADRGNTQRITQHKYDADGRTTFESYPMRSYGNAVNGVRHEYDALGRLVASYADSELGVLTTTNWYDPSVFRKVHTGPGGQVSTYAYQVFDQPSEDAIATIRAPEGVQVAVNRDTFAKPLSITRSGNGKSLTRSYVYDQYQRLCKTIEPETGATIQHYDGASNIDWRATGMALPAAACDNGDGVVPGARRTVFTYDPRNRLETTTYGDASPSILRTYTPDGLPDTVTSNGAKWKYDYNKRRLNTGETLTYGGKPYVITRKYDANASLSELGYPADNLTLTYNPNALGEARKVGGYATGIRYNANGAIEAFTYGNGIARTFRQNVRGLPEYSTDAGVLDEKYAYDANGNVTQIDDNLPQHVATRTMGYDGLDRLRTVAAPGLWGTATYGYDALDNLVSSAISGGANARTLTHNINTTSNRLTSITGGPAAFNFAYGYDAQGNITRRGTQSYTFDQGNRMTAAAGRASYAYDGLGRRFSTVGTDGVNTIQIYTQDGKLLYSGPPGGGGTKYIYLHKHVIAEVK
jgi:YD repeat-containing protein